MKKNVDHPPHYALNPTGIEAIEVTEHMDFLLGNTIKYIWRVAFGGKEGADPVEDLEKAAWYLERAIAKREKDERNKISTDPTASGGPRFSVYQDRETRGENGGSSEALQGGEA